MTIRVAGADPGTSSLDVIILDDGLVVDQSRFTPEQVRQSPQIVIDWLLSRGPFHLVAAPSGYGLPIVLSRLCTNEQRRLMSLVRSDDHQAHGVGGFGRLVEAFCRSALPAVFLPGVIHFDSVPAHRKHNRIDLGTADKVCVAALALHQIAEKEDIPHAECSFCLVELGSAFTACLMVHNGKIVAGQGGTSGPMGWQGGGYWDGEVAYLASPLTKSQLFRGGITSYPDEECWGTMLQETVIQAVAGLCAIVPVRHIVLSGRLLEKEPVRAHDLEMRLSHWGQVHRLGNLPGAWVKHAAQGAALLADGLTFGRAANLVKTLSLKQCHGTILDWLAPTVQRVP